MKSSNKSSIEIPNTNLLDVIQELLEKFTLLIEDPSIRNPNKVKDVSFIELKNIFDQLIILFIGNYLKNIIYKDVLSEESIKIDFNYFEINKHRLVPQISDMVSWRIQHNNSEYKIWLSPFTAWEIEFYYSKDGIKQKKMWQWNASEKSGLEMHDLTTGNVKIPITTFDKWWKYITNDDETNNI